jgi:mono/diheme cytochrome c family protein
MACAAAGFSLIALVAAWNAAPDGAWKAVELPLDAAQAQSASGASSASAASSATAATPSSAPHESNAVADNAAAELVKRGEYLTRAGDCVACHTADKSRPFAGGQPIGTPFGTIYTSNITPDAETGIGTWTDAEFLRAMREGIGKDGKRLYPAFPYPSYTRVAERDLLAIRAYLNTVAPVHYTPPGNELAFPFNQRWLMFFWNLLNFDRGRFVPDPKQNPLWNRGAYLVEGLGHCEECHTPRNFMQGLKTTDRFSGEVQAGWLAYNITPDKTHGIGDWSDEDLTHYLATGVAPGRASAAGPMASVVANSTQYLSTEDLRAICVYLRTIAPVAGGATRVRARDQWGKPVDDVERLRGATVTGVNGGQLFIANCATCHGWTGQGIGADSPLAYPSLIHNSIVGATDAGNLAMVILHGVERPTKAGDVLMPGFAAELDDDEVASLTNYLTQHFGDPHTTLSASDVAKLRAHRQ